jgi:YegS/Rv2252/BmrU family lipid kinase
MKKALLLYNPKAGNRQIVQYLDGITKRVQRMGYELSLYRSEAKNTIEEYIIENVAEENTDLLLISGGDGTINECINGMAKKGLDIPLGILPLGTANDFANAVGIPMDIRGAMEVIETQEPVATDIGMVNDYYFMNVCSMGLFTGVSHVIDLDLKKKFGKLAYYVKGLEELQNYHAMDLTIETDEEILKGKYLLVLIFNGKGAGGFMKLAKYAQIDDGMFDAICIKNIGIHEIPILFLKILQGDHLEDSNIDYIKSKKIAIKCHNTEHGFATDIDGEEGPIFPFTIQNIARKVRIFRPKFEEIE